MLDGAEPAGGTSRSRRRRCVLFGRFDRYLLRNEYGALRRTLSRGHTESELPLVELADDLAHRRLIQIARTDRRRLCRRRDGRHRRPRGENRLSLRSRRAHSQN